MNLLMSNMSLIAIVGIAILVTATVGFGATLSTTPTFNLIGASDNNVVGTARGNITNLAWTEQVGTHGEIETDQIDFRVGNTDPSIAIIFDVCAVVEFNNGSAYFSPAAGSAPACVTTDSIPASSYDTTNTIAFTLPINVTEIVDISFSMEESTP